MQVLICIIPIPVPVLLVCEYHHQSSPMSIVSTAAALPAAITSSSSSPSSTNSISTAASLHPASTSPSSIITLVHHHPILVIWEAFDIYTVVHIMFILRMRILGVYLGMGVFGQKVLTCYTWAYIRSWALFRYGRYFRMGFITGDYGMSSKRVVEEPIYRQAVRSSHDHKVSQWFQLVRQHNCIWTQTPLLPHDQQKLSWDAKSCDKDFWKFGSSVFHSRSQSIKPQLDMSDTAEFFQHCYSSNLCQYSGLSFLSAAPGPTAVFNDTDITIKEAHQSSRKSRASSASSPIDHIPYLILPIASCCSPWSLSGPS